MEAGLVLGVVAMEEQSSLMGSAEERIGQRGATEPINHCSCLKAPTADLQIVMNRLCGEVQKLEMDP